MEKRVIAGILLLLFMATQGCASLKRPANPPAVEDPGGDPAKGSTYDDNEQPGPDNSDRRGSVPQK
ncbi:hypothetical protein H1S01_13905 [Heliobacterium chlorum]|uniref:Lipoprotein n=1 Tax=Heliobacterium chlorum TaxID=2698 RepID=A0ABR7T487_HELCL|nr:hypothetical protein [Heliobacterium chlorum]MBC9785585.1 hypothetical protein [Heliobacterium chlorum]